MIHKERFQFRETILGFPMMFVSESHCFSPKHVDKGTLAMLEKAKLEVSQKILDLGCGYGVVGIVCAKIVGEENVIMIDVDPTAISLARRNTEINDVPNIKIIQSDGFTAVKETGFDVIFCNPPYHRDFSVAKIFIEKGFNRLKLGGKFYMVTKRREWYKQKLIHIFGGVKIYDINGYFVFEAQKRSYQYQNRLKENTRSLL